MEEGREVERGKLKKEEGWREENETGERGTRAECRR